MTTHHRLPDTRPYPTDPVKNELLLHAGHIAANSSKAQTQLARESLHHAIAAMLQQNHYLGLSVALSMAADAPTYSALWQSLAEVLNARGDAEIQWLALPVVVVAGAKQAAALPGNVPVDDINKVLASTPWGQALNGITWLPQLYSAAELAAIKADAWFAAKQNAAAAAAVAAAQPGNATLSVPAEQSVQVFYALAFGGHSLQAALNQPLAEAALPLMQVWQQHFATPGATLFANPLPPLAPLAALREGSALRLRMAGDVFATNAIRAVRLQSPRVGVVMAAQAGGRLLFGFNATDSVFEIAPQVFTWPLSPGDNIDTIAQQFIDLLAECRVENIRLLHEPIAESAELPSYAQAVSLPGHNPLFAQSH